MPIYEFFCPQCHTVYSFFASSPSRRKTPSCPSGRKHVLEKKPSTFAMVSSRDDSETDELGPFMDVGEEKLGGAFEAMAREMERFGDSDDPRMVAEALKRFGEMSGMELGPRMQDALARLEAGDDLDAIERDLDDGGAGEEDLSDFFRLKKLAQTRRAPRVDKELYFMD